MRPWIGVVCVIGALAPFPLYAHPGPLDSYGCHPNVAHRSYHCHAGPLAGRQYSSKEEMLQALNEHERQQRPRPKIAVRNY